MNANDPAMTKISPMNAGMLVGIGIESWDWYWYLSSYINGFLDSILRDRGHIVSVKKSVRIINTFIYCYLPKLLTFVP